MAEKVSARCTRPTGGPAQEETKEIPEEIIAAKKEIKPMIKVGKKAPEFTAAGYQKGGFIGNVQNSVSRFRFPDLPQRQRK
ncbi:MAG: peroxiredoxin [Desulfobacter sp.]|nr:peroxiredoxin [Desulfobacter sp.]WDP85133.1 MAG: peroxiredoxin [Desulfobacter sp.]